MLKTPGNFVIFPIDLKQGKIHVIGDVLSRAPHIMMEPKTDFKIM